MGFPEVFRRQFRLGENVNVTVAAYVNTQGRLKLYGYLRKLGKSVVYCDTDSVIYVQKVDEPQK